MRYRIPMHAASFAPPLPFLDSPRLSVRFRLSPTGWAVLASLVVHGLALGWLPGLQQAQDLVSRPLRVLLPAPITEPVAVPPPPTFPRELRKADASVPTPVLTRSAQAPVADAPAVSQAPAAPPVAMAEPATAPAMPQPVFSAPVLRPTTTDPAALAAYGRNLAGAVARHQRYPRLAQIRQWQGTTLLQLELAAEGQLQSVRVLSSSGHEILDQQAIDMVRAATPLPPLPASLAGRSLTVDVPVVFRLAS
jgi:protein TonB